jgi:uncharacterized phage protein gp47/JayE
MASNLTSQQILENLIYYLKDLDPAISTEEGDPIRLILQAVSQELAQAEFTSLASDNFLDLASKSGADLDAFGSFFGIQRWAGTQANVVLEFYSNEPLKTSFTIQQGTIATDGSHPFETTQSVTFKAGTTSISVPAQSESIGSNQNVQAYTLTQLPSSLSQTGIFVQNTAAATGGTNEETDKHYRQRIQNTFLKNHVGTPASYEILAFSIDNATRASCVSAISTFSEQNEIVPLKTSFGGGDGFVSTITDAKYVYPSSSYMVKNALQEGQTNYIEGVQYTFDTSTMADTPIFQIASQDLSNLLSNYSGQMLDKLGQTLGLSRFQGAPTAGTLIVTNTTPYAYAYQLPAGSEFSLYNSAQAQSFTLSLGQSANIPGGSSTSQIVPFTFEGLGMVEVETGTEVSALGSTPSNFTATIQSISQGSPAWTDNQYRSQLEALYASQTGLTEGDLVYTQFRYCADCSRNNPPATVNKLDIFTDASNLQETTEIGLINLTEITSTNQQNWITASGTYPPLNSYIQILSTPANSQIAGTLTDGSTEYQVTYLRDNTLLRNSDKAQNAVLFPSGSALPTAGDSYSIPIFTNQAVIDTQNAITEVTSIGVDALVHEGRKAMLTVNLVIIPLLGTPAQTLQTFCETQISNYLEGVQFGSQVVISDLVNSLFTASSGVSYIKAVRLAETNDIKAPTIDGSSLNLGIQLTQEYSDTGISGTYTGDFYLPQDTIPALNSVNIAIEASNTYVNSFVSAGSSTSSNGQATQSTGDWFRNPQFYVA